MNTIPQTGKSGKSERLLPEEYQNLKDFRAQFITELACADYIGIGRAVLNRVLLIGSGSPDTIKSIRKKLKKHPQA